MPEFQINVGGNMTIHHDKLAYGRLAKTSEEMTDAELLKMLAELNGEQDEADPQKEAADGKSAKDKKK